jgi:hypothetical protein
MQTRVKSGEKMFEWRGSQREPDACEREESKIMLSFWEIVFF